jgi:hypothetical protein
MAIQAVRRSNPSSMLAYRVSFSIGPEVGVASIAIQTICVSRAAGKGLARCRRSNRLVTYSKPGRGVTGIERNAANETGGNPNARGSDGK